MENDGDEKVRMVEQWQIVSKEWCSNRENWQWWKKGERGRGRRSESKGRGLREREEETRKKFH